MDSEASATRRAVLRKMFHARAQVAAPGMPVQSGMTVDVSPSGISMMFPEQITGATACQIRFEIPGGGKVHVVQAAAKVVYCVCVGRQGFRIGFHFSSADPQRIQLINAL